MSDVADVRMRSYGHSSRPPCPGGGSLHRNRAMERRRDPACARQSGRACAGGVRGYRSGCVAGGHQAATGRIEVRRGGTGGGPADSRSCPGLLRARAAPSDSVRPCYPHSRRSVWHAGKADVAGCASPRSFRQRFAHWRRDCDGRVAAAGGVLVDRSLVNERSDTPRLCRYSPLSLNREVQVGPKRRRRLSATWRTCTLASATRPRSA